MSELEEKIKNERAFFNAHEPKPGHKERFIDMLESEPAFKKSRNLNAVWIRVAASLIILLSASYMVFNFLTENNSKAQNVLLIEYNEDFENILTYYDQKAIEKVEELEKLTSDSEQAEMIKKAVQNQFEDIDISMAAIEKDYQKDPDNEKLKAAMINSKRNKLKVMDQVMKQLNMSNHQLF